MTRLDEREATPVGADIASVIRALRRDSHPLGSVDGHERPFGHFVTVVADSATASPEVIQFAVQGIEQDERVIALVDASEREAFESRLRDTGADVGTALETGMLHFYPKTEIAAPKPSQPTCLAEYVERAIGKIDDGETARIVADVGSVCRDDPSREELVDYERALTDVCADSNVVAFCQYDRGTFSASLIRDIVRAHPYLVTDAGVAPNVHFTPPAALGSPEPPDRQVDRMLDTARTLTKVSTTFGEKERQLRRTDDRLRLVLEAGGHGTWELDLRSETAPRRSPQHDRIFGYDEPLDDWSFERFLEHVHPGDRDAVEESFEAAFETGEWSFECRIVRADGEQSWIAANGEFYYDAEGDPVRAVGVVEDVTDRKELERELRTEKEHFQLALENSPFAAFRLDTDLRYTWLSSPHIDFDPASVIGKRDDELLPEDAAEVILEPKRQVLETGEGVRGEYTYELPSGTVTYDLTVEPLRDESGEVVGLTCAALDITERKRLERTLTRLHEVSRDLIGAESLVEASERTAAAAADVFDVDGVIVYLFDDTNNSLNPAVVTDGIEALGGDLPVISPGDPSIAWQSFVNGESRQFDDVDEADDPTLADVPVRSGVWLPIGDHGVLAIVSTAVAGLPDQTQEVADHLAATAEATFDRIEREEALHDQERELAARNRRLHELNRVNDIIREIDQVLVRATTADEIEKAVCERLTRDDRFAFAWIGDVDDGQLTPQTWAGDARGYLDEVDFRLEAETGEPALSTAETGEVSYVPNVAERLREHQWRKTALASGLHSALSLPIRYDGVDYGVLTVYAGETEAFDTLTREVLAELGETIANALNAVETRRGLLSDSVVELRLTIRDAGTALAALATETGSELDVHGTIPQQEGGTRVFVTVRECPPDVFAAAATDSTRVKTVARLSDADESAAGHRFELLVTGETVPSVLATAGATAHTITVSATGARVVVELPGTIDVRTFVDRVDERFPETDLVARREVERRGWPGGEVPGPLTGDFTDRQREVLQTAYLSGYFEWPRDRTGEEVAESLGITQPTFNRHLRTAERKLFARLFDQASLPPE
ncbi:putative DNA binding protein [Halogeometricum pallidum JCM 14848]|uniref:histidine kinase n=1 Tax=Halogeometricum pallidum JCM 14848 TaxID=1227487 RepID=M0D9M7_HALPD|nr:bacterio-opsin activator domain-containing protein [Halogeometricum pallidum]ELZ31422.1 putative DNA binding protein [Halogeometricum pallidum JCM 14848]